MARTNDSTDDGTGTRHLDGPPGPLDRWLAGLDASGVAEAHACLLSGRYSHRMLASLRSAFPVDTHARHSLDDPHHAEIGDPLGASLQTALRDSLLAGRLPDAHSHRWGV